jgi:hypothetical protein
MKQQFQPGDQVLTPEGRGYVEGIEAIGEYRISLPQGIRFFFDDDLELIREVKTDDRETSRV